MFFSFLLALPLISVTCYMVYNMSFFTFMFTALKRIDYSRVLDNLADVATIAEYVENRRERAQRGPPDRLSVKKPWSGPSPEEFMLLG